MSHDDGIVVQEKNTEEPRIIAFFLTQFHPIPENDVWWGKGFTEWTNVSKARPLYEGHYQPHLPADLGFYDLRVRETHREQARMAHAYGIDAFCYHYYWFSGKRLLERPLDEMLADSEMEMPFCLCWANETWSRRWNGKEEDVLIAQQYRPEDDVDFIRDLMPYLKDPRYLKVDGKPFVIVYRPAMMPDPKRSTAVWRSYCQAEGIGAIHLCAAFTFGNTNCTEMGFDSGVEFPPHNIGIGSENDLARFFRPFRGKLYDYSKVAKDFLQKDYGDKRVFKTIFPSWDNSARTGERAVIMHNGTPDNFEYWLARTIDKTASEPAGDKLVFVNAWNEWAEGCHLEPDTRYGVAFLEAVRRVRQGIRRWEDFPHAHIHLFESEQGFRLRHFAEEIGQVWVRHWSLLSRSIALFFLRIERLRSSYLYLAEGFRLLRWRIKKPIKQFFSKK